MSSRRVAPSPAVQADLFGDVAPAPSVRPTPDTPPPPSLPASTSTQAASLGPLVVSDGTRRLEALFERDLRAKRTTILVDPRTKIVRVIAPLTEPMASIERFVRSRIAWAQATLRGLADSRAIDAIDIEHAGETLTLAYVPSERARRATLRVDARTGHIKLIVPPRMSRAQALEFARQHAGWIALRLKRRHQPVPFADGATIPIFDRPHRIRHRPEARGTAWIEGAELHVAGGAEHVSRRVGDWLTAQLRTTLAPLARDKAARINKRVGHIALRDTTSQWGSCAAMGDLCFSLRLVFAPTDVVDYVVAHEVAHLVHHNHSARFWALNQSLTAADVATCKAWLRRHGPGLMRYG